MVYCLSLHSFHNTLQCDSIVYNFTYVSQDLHIPYNRFKPLKPNRLTMASTQDPRRDWKLRLKRILRTSDADYTVQAFVLGTISAYICFKNPCNQDLGHIASEHFKITWAPIYLVWYCLQAILVCSIGSVWLCCTYVFPPCEFFLSLATALHQYAHHNPTLAAIIAGFVTTCLLLLPPDRQVEEHDPHPPSSSADDASTGLPLDRAEASNIRGHYSHC